MNAQSLDEQLADYISSASVLSDSPNNTTRQEPKQTERTDMNTQTDNKTVSETLDKFREKGYGTPQYNLDDCGCYVDCARGIYAIDKIVSFAESHGMPSPEVPEHNQTTVFQSRFASYEFSSEIEDEATDYMNDKYAVDGAYWGRSEQGDWGLFQTEDNQ